MLAALAHDDPTWVVGCMVMGLTLHPFTLAGLFCTPNDLSTKYAGRHCLWRVREGCAGVGQGVVRPTRSMLRRWRVVGQARAQRSWWGATGVHGKGARREGGPARQGQRH